MMRFRVLKMTNNRLCICTGTGSENGEMFHVNFRAEDTQIASTLSERRAKINYLNVARCFETLS